MTLLENADYFVRIVPFPVAVGGMTILNSDGTYSVYVNANMDCCRQQKAYWHELKHIVNGDFHNDVPITEIEDL